MAAYLVRRTSPVLSQLAVRRSMPFPQQHFLRQPILHWGIRSVCSKTQASNPEPKQTQESAMSLGFWSSSYLWKRAGINTFRCLIGCSLGDFSAMWYLQANCPDMSVGLVMGISMICGLSSSMALETILLRLGRDQLTWVTAAKTAAGMSMVSMLGMETVQNLVDFHLTSGVVALDDPKFWMAAAASAFAGFLAPLPYNYSRLKKYGKSCH
ncbi:uncharacterized protein CIMG_12755 [Coccidioides immitis RS]|uniref:DUF4396 domain-containing protein n=4 Tax=Coccidioides immitis TaxID=5501 RepID=J3KK03_COCIM|nr:uncharacterized protein CIMG_12755 [Coccidioides immitis RS]KMP01823.1 hypothetical protein CIRG_01962 [Coccidioides immitis RMSCC 2394]KMU73288.1 hypothetical protein CISG_10004 [Coccidioides immitis RMSCC 3703]KMU88132.1 hypothetical protein CIHG_05900 [Coccidioides immitis H538.4]TPX25413.1 hypothetical protein DIZ76_010868 [Coccidioides immitis]EAS36466.3 hypothetical protein CIMG_12755 [Coccidioides immitis RS]